MRSSVQCSVVFLGVLSESTKSSLYIKIFHVNVSYVQHCFLFFREDLAGLKYTNIEILPNSPSQNGSDALLSFYVDLPGGSGTLRKDVLEAILSTEKNNILSQPSTIITTSPIDSGSTSDQLVQLTIRDFTPDQVGNFRIGLKCWKLLD